MKKIILFDVDYTLSNRDFLRSFGRHYLASLVGKTVEELNPTVDKIIKESWKKFGIFDIYYYSKRISEELGDAKLEQKLINMFLTDYPYDKALYPEVRTALNKLKDKYILGIQTDGQAIFQLKKIESIVDFFERQYIFVFKNKQEEIYEKIKNIEHSVIIIDDKPEYIDKLMGIDIQSVLVKRGHFAEEYVKNPNGYPNIKETISDLNELVLLLK